MNPIILAILQILALFAISDSMAMPTIMPSSKVAETTTISTATSKMTVIDKKQDLLASIIADAEDQNDEAELDLLSEKRIANTLKLLALLNEEEETEKQVNEAEEEADFDEFLATLLATMEKQNKNDKVSSRKHKLSAILRLTTTTEKPEIYEIIDDDANLDDEDFDDFLATLLVSMDKRNPFVLHKEKILNIQNKRKQVSSSSSTTPVISASSSEGSTLSSSSSTKKVNGAEQAAAAFLRTNDDEKSDESSKPAQAAALVETTPEEHSSEWKLVIFGTVSSLLALLLSIASLAAICSVIYYRRSPKQLPLLSPRFPLFSPSDGFSAIYKKRKFNIPKKSRKEAEEYKKSCEQQQQYLQQKQQQELASPEVDEAHYGAHDFLNASLSSM